MVTAKKAAKKKAPVKRKIVASTTEAPKATGARRRPAERSNYFAIGKDNSTIDFIASGCSLLDEVLGGGWALGRVSNVVGDKSAGKTLLAIEATANFALMYPKGLMRYAESEAAFDPPYAAALGMPVDRVMFNPDGQPMATVEEWYADLEAFVLKCEKARQPGIYVLDSLDALSDADELESDFNKDSFGGKKPKAIGQLFRRLVSRIESAPVHLMIVSQIRDKLNVTFGEKHTRSGGKALDFYASQVIWLAEIGKIRKTIAKVERPVGVNVKVRCKKNKVGLPFRECEYPIYFGYGIDDMTAGAEWLIDVCREDELATLGLTKERYKQRIEALRTTGEQECRELRTKMAATVHRVWMSIETSFLPKSSKY
jgi:protein RecA